MNFKMADVFAAFCKNWTDFLDFTFYASLSFDEDRF